MYLYFTWLNLNCIEIKRLFFFFFLLMVFGFLRLSHFDGLTDLFLIGKLGFHARLNSDYKAWSYKKKKYKKIKAYRKSLQKKNLQFNRCLLL